MGFRIGLAGFSLAALALAACGDGAAGSRDVEASQSNERWELRLRIPGEVRPGEMIAVELSLKNVSHGVLRADTDCIAWFDLIVLNEAGEQVFAWRDHVIEAEYNGMHPQCPARTEEVAPGEAVDETVSFQVDEPGEYTVSPQPPSETVGSSGQPIDLSMSVQVRAQ